MSKNGTNNISLNGSQASRKTALENVLRKACKKIAPVWPLENFVAVNPYLGLTDQKFESAAQDLAAAGGIQMTLPASFYLQKIREGQISKADVSSVLKKRNSSVSVDEFISNIKKNQDSADEITTVASVADVAAEVTSKDWSRFQTNRISLWAASYFDHGQAIWSAANKQDSLFASWKAEAEIDRAPEISGLKGFRKLVKDLPNEALAAAEIALDKLGVSQEAMPIYLHRLLLRMGGWSAYAARVDWDNELYGGKDGKLKEFLAVLLCWEACLLRSINNPVLDKQWKESLDMMSHSNIQKSLNQQITQKHILQDAFDLAAQRNLVHKINSQLPETKTKNVQPLAQAIFCIDVRSEVFRRNLEVANNSIETLGFAGFFAFPINYKPIGQESGEANCPVLLKTGPTIHEQMPDKKEQEQAVNNRILNRQAQQVWKSFKSGAVTCFSFVSPMGLAYLPKLFTDSFGLTRPVPHPEKVGLSKKFIANKSISLTVENTSSDASGIPLDQQIGMAKNALKAMSLSEDFAQFILITGHGATTVNNPHATGYDCGACGGHSGEANARVAAVVLNNKAVRAGLQKEDIYIPVNTVFLACLHDTTTDEVRIYNENDVPSNQQKELKELKESLKAAGHSSRIERSLRLSNKDAANLDKAMIGRSKDWSQVRPEWGLAGCAAFVVAPRERTRNLNFEGKSFLHSYQWEKDENFAVLELIMTAPMVVTSWINLQYYGSTVDNKNFGSGNKTLHNVTAGLGVLEGYAGDLRVGLPLQAVHDGENYQHEPLKLNVIIEAPIDAMNTILEKHPTVKDLCDNGWINLLAMNEEGMVSHRYENDLHWEEVSVLAA